MTETPMFTEADFRQFERLSGQLASHDPVKRLQARHQMREFREKHGKAKCDAMWARICASEANLKRVRAM